MFPANWTSVVVHCLSTNFIYTRNEFTVFFRKDISNPQPKTTVRIETQNERNKKSNKIKND